MGNSPDAYVTHSGGRVSVECPTIGCNRGREVICNLTFMGGARKTVSACEKCIDWYVSRAVMRHIKMTRGQEGVVQHVDGGERRCIK